MHSRFDPLGVHLSLLGGILISSELAAQNDSKQENSQDTADRKVKFAFDQTPWEPVIKDFAKQADLYLQPHVVEMPPQGFRYTVKKEITVRQALDILNQELAIHEYTLIRNGEMLHLVRLDDLKEAKYSQFFEEVKLEDLKKRGNYDIVVTAFSLGDLVAEEIEEDVKPYISDYHRDGFKLALGANRMVVRERVGNLKKIHDLIVSSQTRLEEQKGDLSFVKLEHGSTEDVMPALRFSQNLDEQNVSLSDPNVRVFVDPFGDRLGVRGDKKTVQSIIADIKEIDQAMKAVSETQTEPRFFKRYNVKGDADAVFKVIVTLMSKEGWTNQVAFDRKEDSNQLFLDASQEIHDQVLKWIAEVESPTVVVDSVDLNHLSTTAMLSYLEQFFPSTTTAEGENAEPELTFVEDEENERIIIRGTPIQVSNVKDAIAKLDVPLRINQTNRKQYRVLPMSQFKADQALRTIEDLFEGTGRPNIIQIVEPNQRKKSNRFLSPSKRDQSSEDKKDSELKKDSGNLDSSPPSEKKDSAERNDGVSRQDRRPFRYTSMPTRRSPQDQDEKKDDDDEKSVPGAPITIELTEIGLLIKSQDLDALDELEYLIREYFDVTETGEPTLRLFKLERRDPQKVMSQLENLINGPDTSGGGGGGGNPLLNMANNALNQASGLNPMSLFGGDSLDSGGGLLPVVDDVMMQPDTRLRALWVKAVPEDLDLIEQVIEIIDSEQPEHAVLPFGENPTLRIPLAHRDPTEVADLVRKQFPDLIKAEGGSGGQPNPQQVQQQMQQQMMRQMQQLMGGRGGRGGGGGGRNQVEDETPKATLGVDTAGNALLVTGPKYIAKEIFDFVTEHVDLELEQPKQFLRVIQTKGQIDPSVIGRAIQGSFGEKIESNMGETNSAGGNRPATANANPNQNRQSQAQQRAAQQQQIQNAQRFFQMMRGGQGRGGGRGTGGNRGGGNRGGGNRGGR